jgi:hypothetical protein
MHPDAAIVGLTESMTMQEPETLPSLYPATTSISSLGPSHQQNPISNIKTGPSCVSPFGKFAYK